VKRLFIALFVSVIGLGLIAQDAEARRLGGGRTFGMSRDSGAMKQASPAPTAPSQNAVPAKPLQPAATPQAPAPQPSGMSRWLGPIAGIAAGVGLAALLSHFGMGEGVATMLMLALLVMAAVFVFRLLMRRSQPQAAFAGGPARIEPVHFEPAAPMGSTPATNTASVPAGFDTEGFLRQAKLNFIRLQAANDAGNLDDLKQFTAPEVYAEIQMQFEERGHAKQETDVQHLDAQLLEVVTEGDRHIASVRFFGQIREEASAAPQAFAEVWHLTKPVSGSGGWMVAGIQQIQ
jgi:predicted lipid-binding transport protein (Tim44 family)